MAGNAPAIAFWRRTVDRFTGGQFEGLEARGGPTQRFEVLFAEVAVLTERK